MNSDHPEDSSEKKMLSVQRPLSTSHCACCSNHAEEYTMSTSPTSLYGFPTSSFGGTGSRLTRQKSFDQLREKAPTKTKIFTPNINLRGLFTSPQQFREDNLHMNNTSTPPPPLVKTRLTDHIANGFDALESSNTLLQKFSTTKYYKYQKATTLSIVKPQQQSHGNLIRIQRFREGNNREKIEKFPMPRSSPGAQGLPYDIQRKSPNMTTYEQVHRRRSSPGLQSPFERTISPYGYPSPHNSHRTSPNLPTTTTILTSPPPLVRTTPPPPPTSYMSCATNVAAARLRNFKQPNSFDSTTSMDSSFDGSDEDESSCIVVQPKPTPRRAVERAKYERTIKLYKFLIDLLEDQHSCVMWIDRKIGIFKITDSEQLAHLWGEVKLNASMTYEKLARSFRHYYKKGILDSGETVISPVSKNGKRKLYYKFSAVTLKRFLDIDPE